MLQYRTAPWTLLLLSTLPTIAQPTWTKLEGAMQTPRSEMGGGYIGGKFYLPGGYNNSADVLDVSEVYDLENQSWSTFTPMPEPLEHHMVEAVGDNLYVFKESTHIYNPESNEWSEGAGAVYRPDGTTCVHGPDVYVMAGFVDLLQKYNTLDDSWTDLAPMQVSRGHARAVCLEGKIVVLAGIADNNQQTDVVEVYDIESGKWSTGTPMQDVRSGFSAGVLSGKIVVAGGEKRITGSPEIITSVEIYDPELDTWEYLPEMPVGLHGTAYEVVDNKLYILGGSQTPYWVENEGAVYVLDLNEPVTIQVKMIPLGKNLQGYFSDVMGRVSRPGSGHSASPRVLFEVPVK